MCMDTVAVLPHAHIDSLHTHTSALRGPGFGSKPGPTRNRRAGPLHNFVGRAWPGPT